jgi:hypothetical protein
MRRSKGPTNIPETERNPGCRLDCPPPLINLGTGQWRPRRLAAFDCFFAILSETANENGNPIFNKVAASADPHPFYLGVVVPPESPFVLLPLGL